MFKTSMWFLTAISLFSVLPAWAEPIKSTAAIAMPDEYSAKIAKQVLLSGGNAVDAAVASAFVLAVTYPEAGNLGGGGFMTLYAAESTEKHLNDAHSRIGTAHQKMKAYFLDYREKAPKSAHRDMYLDDTGAVIPYASLVGYQASGVPGTVKGMWMAHQRFGSLPWSQLLAPAIAYAKQGFRVSSQLDKRALWFQQWIANKSTSPLNFSAYFANLKEGRVFRQPELAKSLELIAQQGESAFYRGEIAQKIVLQMQRPEKPSHKGLITLEDLQHYQAVWRAPVMGEWRGRTIISAPPPSSGGVAIIQLLKMQSLLQAKLQERLTQARKHGATNEAVQAIKTHFYAELEKRAFADRAHYLGDSDFIEVPIEPLLSQTYLARRSQGVLFDALSETESVQPGKIESPETTHFSIRDAQGMAVSNTYTLNMPFGNGVVIEGAGFLMNNEMDDFSTKPGVANVFGVIGGKANEIAAEKRMLSSMSPTIVIKNGAVEMVVGTPGGSTIITSVFQAIVNVIAEKMSAQQAVDAPRVHHQLLPQNQIAYNPELPSETKERLEEMGYQLKRHNYMGDVQLVANINGQWQAASDVRGTGVAEVFVVPSK